ncbi:MAG: Tm-1-like ATP-binding domain-containing protein, partial [Anaerolineae bacterium]|nr:Tm-1-like ATP-binding domain-containing protein [Anaerolineae bacterium]
MPKTVALLGSLDTKGVEYGFVKQCIESRGLRTLVIDTGVLGSPRIAADVPREAVAAAGGANLADLVARQDRGEAVAAMARGAAALVAKLYSEKRFDGILALGGGGGTSVACAAMRGLPL